MKKLINFLKRLNAKIGSTFFVLFALCKSWLFPTRRFKILFSKHPGFENNIRKGFRFTQHKITFEEFTPENIKNYDLVVPLYIRDLMYLNETDHSVQGNPIPIPSRESIVLCDNKHLFSQEMITGGFADFIPKIGSELTYPYILKKSISDSSEHIHIIKDQEQEKSFINLVSSQEYYCQKIIPGSREYATHILFMNREIVYSINIEYVFDTNTPIKRKDKAIYTKICCCPYLEIFSSILMRIGFEGLCCVNYKVIDNHPYVLEINPRFGSSLSPFFFIFLRYIK